MLTRYVRILVATVLMAAPLGVTVAEAAPRLRLGAPRVGGDGVAAVPVILVAARADDIAALNFTVRYDATKLRPSSQAPTVGSAVARARAQLASVTDEAGTALRVIVVPEFTPVFPALRSGRIATVYFTVQQVPHGRRIRSVRRSLAIQDVVFGDRRGRELGPVLRPRER